MSAKLKKTLSRMEAKRLPHENHYRDAFDFSDPARSMGFYSNTYDATEIQDKQASILDDTLQDASKTLIAHISSIAPSSQQWFDFDDDDRGDQDAANAAQLWLAEAARLIWKNIHFANFDSAWVDMLGDVMGAYGVMFIDEGEEGGLRFEWLSAHQCYLSSSKAGNSPDTLFRKYCLTCDQIVSQFNKSGDAVPENIRRNVEDGKGDELIPMCHAVYPRTKKSGSGSKFMDFASCHFIVGTDHTVRESGYHEQPFAVARWSVIPDSVYSVGPVARALATAKTLNRLKEMQMSALDLNIGGVWKARDDGILNPSNIKIKSRTVIPVSDMDNLQPLRDGVDFQASFVSEQQMQAEIRRLMMADQLPPVDSGVRTATEFQVRMQMLRQIMGPLAGRITSEFFSTLIDRCFGLMLRAGVLGSPPRDLGGVNIKPRYLSVISRSQRSNDIQAITESTVSAMQLAQVSPEAMDNIDIDKAVRDVFGLNGAGGVLRKINDRDQMRNQRHQAQQAQQQMQMAAPVVQDAAKQAITK